MLRFTISIFLIGCFFLGASAQETKLSGIVRDASSKQTLAFVSVSIKENSTGTTTDIDGHFSFATFPSGATLVISYVGYKTTEFIVEKKMGKELSIEIEKIENQLETVIIGPGENPAHRIILLMQQNRDRNDPYKLSSFKYNAYTVAALGGGSALFSSSRPDTIVKEMKVMKLPKQTGKDEKADSMADLIMKRFKENYLMLTESYTERIFRYPGKSKETVLATKISGMKESRFAITASNFQPFGFYKDYLPMGGPNPFVSPVINGSIAMYKYRLKETIPHLSDTTYIISFEPKKGKKFNGLKGLLYINSDGYAIENVIASPADEKGLIFRFRLQQKYERIKGHWFPVQLNTTLIQTDAKSDSVLTYWDSRSYITNTSIGDTFPKSAFSDISQELDLAAGRKTDKDWEILRTDTLKDKEKNTYENYKLLPAKTLRRINLSNAVLDALGLEAIPWGKVDIPFKQLISGINRFETFRIGGGLQTNPQFNKIISLGAFAGYGFGDKAWKYGGNLLFTFNERTATKLRISYSQDLQEPGNVEYFTKNGSVLSNQSVRNFMISRMDSVRQYKADLTTKLSPFLQTNLWLLNEQRSPSGYDYLFEDIATGISKRQYKSTELGIGFRYTKGETFNRVGRVKFRSRPPTTQLLVQLSKGLGNILDGELEYTKAAIQWNQVLRSKWLGQTTVQLEVGQVWGNVPYAYLFNTKASLSARTFSVYVPNTFQTVGLYEFVASRSASLFIQHNFGSLLMKPKNPTFRPEFVLVQNIGIGELEHAQSQKNLSVKVPGNGLFETGLLIRNLYRKNLRFLYLGFGGGVFYRYGYYSLPRGIDNWAFKYGINVSF